MICEQKENNIQTSGIKLTKEMGINHEGMGFIQNILRSQIYSDKISSLIREIAVNAIDSHVEAGCPERPIEVTLPSRWETTFKIRDFGTGMSEETILNLYAYFGSSTKRNTNLQSGFMGIGKVAPLSYGDSFILTSFLDGVKNTYNIYVDSENLSQIAKLASEPTIEENGIEILVAVKDYDVQAFHDKAFNLFRYFKIRPKTHGASFEYETKTSIMKGADWAIYANGGQSVAIMGNIAYPIQDHFDDSNITNALSCGLEVHFGIGEISCQASREGLEYTPKTKKAIKDKLTVIVAEVAADLNARFKSCATLFDAHKLYGSVMYYGSNLYLLRSMVKNNLTFNGVAITSGSLRFSEPTDGSFGVRRYEKSYRGNKIKSYSYNSIECSDKCVLIDNDLDISSGITNRVYNLVNADKKVYVLSYRTAADRKKFLDDSGLVESNFIKLSSLPKIVLSTVNGNVVKNSKHSSKEFIYDFAYAATNRWTRKHSNFWTQEVVDVATDAGIYVIIDNFNYRAKSGMLCDPSELKGVVESMKTFGITLPKVYGFKLAKQDAVKKNKNMVCLWQYIADEVTKYFAANKVAQKVANRLEYDQNHSANWIEFAHKGGSKVSAKTNFAKVAKIMDYMKSEADKKILDTAMAYKEYFSATEKPEHNMKKLIAEVESTYPLFGSIGYWHNMGHNSNAQNAMIQYIDLIDG